jgi:hypothetical protein
MRQERETLIQKPRISPAEMHQLISVTNPIFTSLGNSKSFFEKYSVSARILVDELNIHNSDEPWSTRFDALENLFSTWEMREVDDTMVNDILNVLYDRTYPDSSQWETASRKTASIRAGQTYEVTKAIKESLPQKPSFEGSRREQEVSYDESIHNPLVHLTPMLGYEVETAMVKPMTQERMYILSFLGFHTDNDITSSQYLTEYAHGPFRNWKTASYSLGKFINVGAIDLYKAYGQSMHTNFGLTYVDGFPTLNRWLMAAGWAYQPIYDNKQVINPNYEMRIVRKTNKMTKELYMESKEFQLIDYRSAVKHFRASQMLATALNAFQMTQLQYYQGSVNRLFETRRIGTLCEPDIPQMRRKPDIAKRIEATRLSRTEKKLAHIWHESTRLLQKGFLSVGLDEVWGQTVPKQQENEFARLFSQVYPDNQWKATRELSQPHEISTTPVLVSGLEYPNIISFARHLATDTIASIELTLHEAERDFDKRVRDLVQTRDQTIRQRKMNALFELYPCGFTDDTSSFVKYEFLLDRYNQLTGI